MALTPAQEIDVAHAVRRHLLALEAMALPAAAHRRIGAVHRLLANYAKDRGAAIQAPDDEIHVLGGDDKEEPA